MQSDRSSRDAAGSTVVLLGGLLLVLAGLLISTSEPIRSFLLARVSAWTGRPAPPLWESQLQWFAAQLAGSGVLATIGAWLFRRHWASVGAVARKGETVAWLGIAILILVWLPVMLFGHSAIIGGQRYWFLEDDAMISMRYAKNLAEGNGLTWNPGERVEGYSNFLWTIVMSIVHLFPLPPAKTSLVMLLLNLVVSVALVPVVMKLVNLLGGRPVVGLAVVAATTLNDDLMFWAASGLETMLLTVVFLLVAVRILEEAQARRPSVWTYVLGATLPLVRADAYVLYALLVLISIVLNTERSRILLYCGISLLLPLLHEILRISYYHAVLPNTAYLKITRWDGRTLAGIQYTAKFLLRYAPFVLLAMLLVWRTKSGLFAVLTAALLAYSGYVVYIGGDAFYHYRFFIPVLPILMALAFISVQESLSKWSGKVVLAAVCLATMPLALSDYWGKMDAGRGGDAGNVEIGLLLRENTSPSSKVADFWAGSVFYFSGRYGIDLLGKSDPHIAHLPVASAGTTPGHNKFDFTYSLGTLRPDVVVANFKLPVSEESMTQASTGNFAYTGRLYFDPVFRDHYARHPVRIASWRSIFVSDWSPECRKQDAWKELASGTDH